MHELDDIASIPTQAPPRPNRDLTHVHANSLAFWRAKVECAAYDYKWFPSDRTRRHFFDMWRVFKRTQREHWRTHDPARWRVATCDMELKNIARSRDACGALGIPTDDLDAEWSRVYGEQQSSLHEIAMRPEKMREAEEAAGVVRRLPRRQPRIRSV